MASLDLQRFAYPYLCFNHSYFTGDRREYGLSDCGKKHIDEAAQIIIQHMMHEGKPIDIDIRGALKQTPYFYFKGNQIHFGRAQSSKRAHSAGLPSAKVARKKLDPSLQVASGKRLNLQQQKAVQHQEGPMLILAGPGSGKTFVLTERVKFLVGQGISSKSLLMVTFTKKAAREMKERLEEEGVEGVLVKTFHSFGVCLLKRYLSICEKKPNGLRVGFKIYDDKQSKKIIEPLMRSVAAKKGLKEKLKIDAMIHKIESAKSKGVKPLVGQGGDPDLFNEVYDRYNDHLSDQNAVDFADLLTLSLQMLRDNLDVLALVREQWKYVMVDEYQDTNSTQAQIVELVAGPKRNLLVVGDPKQSIYAWRGANPQVIKDFQGGKTQMVDLQVNYRCAKKIVAHAAALMEGTAMAQAARQDCSQVVEGETEFYELDTCQDEAHFVVEAIKEHLARGTKAGDIAVLFRTRAQSALFEAACAEKGVPFLSQVNPDEDDLVFYQQKEIGNIMDLLRFASDPTSRFAFKRAILSLKVISGGQLQNLLRLNTNTLRGKESWIQACERYCREPKKYPEVGLDKKNRDKLSRFCEKFKKIPLELASAEAIIKNIFDVFSYFEEIKKRYPKHSEEQIQLLEELLHRAHGRSLKEFLEPESGRLRIMTLHCAKGLEFEAVFLVGMEEGLLPSFRAVESDDEKSLEEERRLLYVGITRAKTHLTYTWVKKRYNPHLDLEVENSPSRFLDLLQRQESESA